MWHAVVVECWSLGIVQVRLWNNCHTDSVNINVGGPVWSLAWCPVGFGHTARQYLALYAHCCAADLHVFEQPSHDSAIIQVYDCGILSSRHESHTFKYEHLYSQWVIVILLGVNGWGVELAVVRLQVWLSAFYCHMTTPGELSIRVSVIKHYNLVVASKLWGGKVTAESNSSVQFMSQSSMDWWHWDWDPVEAPRAVEQVRWA